MNLEQLSGTIDHFIFQNTDSGFSVFILICPKKQKTTVTGTFTNIQIGQEIHLQGEWAYHAKFGKQFQVSSYTTTLPTSLLGIKKYLGSGFIKGIGKSYAEKIVDCFGQDTLNIIDQNPEKLLNISGIGKKRADLIIQSWKDQKFVAKIMVFLQEKGVSSSFATKIYKKYGQFAIAKLTQNPYRITEDVWGIGFKTADKIAQNMGFSTGSVQRVQAGFLFTLTQESNNGHVYQEVQELKNKTLQLLELDPLLHANVAKQALTELYQNDKIKLLTYQEKHFVSLRSLYSSEKGIAQKLLLLLQHTSTITIPQTQVYKLLQEHMHVDLNEKQQQGILSCFESKITVITGGPGTGKTTLVKTLLTLLEKFHVSYKLAAPTGRAAKRIMESTNRSALTIHRLLEFDPTNMKFQKNDSNALLTDVLIIDEASMIDIFLMNAIIKSLPLSSHLILIGDIDQLPSVGPGNVLKDLINSNKLSVTKLTEIFRQAQNSMIIQNAHKINKGEFPTNTFQSESKKDFYFIKEDNPELLFSHIKNIFQTILPKHFIKQENTIVLTPMNKGTAGTQTLNHHLQQFLNPHNSNQAQYAGTIFKEGDKVMQIRNNYDKKIFNGDIGFVKTINNQDQTLFIDFDGSIIEYDFNELNEIVLAYAVTIHKSQGSEYDAVIIPIFMQHFMLLQRNLIYTGITRAKKLCIFIGQTKAIMMGIKNNKQEERITFLNTFLTQELSCR